MTTAAIARPVGPAGRRLPRPAAFAFVAIAFAAFFLAAGAPTPLLPLYEREWGFAPSLVTVAFGVYAIGLLGSLLVFGRLSDHVGRRPLLIGALALELGAMVLFLVSPDIGWLIVARVVQGVATGAATSAFSAAIVELAPPARKGLGTILSSVAPAGGLGAGAVLAGAIAQFDHAAQATVWTALVVVMSAGTVLALFVPETSERRAGARRSLRPRVGVPSSVRSRFAVVVPAQFAAWMLSALFMGLMPAILGSVFGIRSPLASGATALLAPASAAVVSAVARGVEARRLAIAGAVAVIVGAGLVVVAIVTATLPLLWIGGVIGGAGFGATFSGTVRMLVPEVAAHERGGLFAAVYMVAYIAFGVPAIVAGLFIASAGVTNIAIVFGSVVAAAAGLGLAGQLRTAGRRAQGGQRIDLRM